MRHQVGAGNVFGRHHRGQRDHLAVARPRVQPGDVGRGLAVWRVGLQDHVPDAAVLVELADLDRAELGLQGAVHILHRHPEQHRLGAVDFGPQLLRGSAERGVQAGKLGPCAGLGEKLLSEFIKARRLSGPLVLDPELKAARGADPGDRGRRYRDGEPCLDFTGCRRRPPSARPWSSPCGRARSRNNGP